MTRIDHSNYEAWLLDRLEGRLSSEEERELEAFLLAHPDIHAEEGPLPAVGMGDDRLARFDREGLKRALPPQGVIDADSLDDYLIARLEGDLGARQVEELERFLAAHPQHAASARLLAATKVAAEPVAFPSQASLKRALPPVGIVNVRTLPDHLVARLEGDLDAEQERALAAYLHQHADARAEWDALQRTKVVAEEIAFPHKDSLKRAPKVIPLFPRTVVRWASAAAVLALVLLAWWFRNPERPQVAQTPGPGMNPPAAITDQDDRADHTPAAEGSASQEPQQPAPDRQRPMPPAPARHAPLNEPVREVPQAPAPQEQPMAHTPAQQEPTHTSEPEPVLVAQAPPTAAQGQQSPASAAAANTDPRSLGDALAGVLRERVLDRPADEQRALDATDAVAAVDRGLKAVAGERAGLSVQRDDQGRQRGFSLRLGRNLAFTASR
ncbi:MAG: hypothetical protein H6591_01945 [Flavobacteriales bacterium]|nr:hypothetical protein [Flavobacteriales bacterium]